MGDVHGECAPRFAAVREAFEANFAPGREVGACFAATLDGEPVVDLWGGFADAARTRPWQRDTIVNVFSTTKAMAALTAHIARRPRPARSRRAGGAALARVRGGGQGVHAGALAALAPGGSRGAARAAPARGALRLAAHDRRAGGRDALVGARHRERLPRDDLRLPRRRGGAARAAAAASARFFRDEVARPLGADFHIGLPESEDARVAELVPPTEAEAAAAGQAPPDPESLLGKVLGNPPLAATLANTRPWRRAEIPAANGHGNARSVARVMAALALRRTPRRRARALREGAGARRSREQCLGQDLVLPLQMRWGLGFMLSHPGLPLGPNPRAFGHGGWGGSLGIADPDARALLGLRDEQDVPGHHGRHAGVRPRRGALRFPVTTPFEFWFEFGSTYSYPAAMRVERVARAQGVEVVWRAFLLGPIFKGLGWNDSPFNLQPEKGRYMWRDLARICEAEGLPLRRPSRFPRNGLLAARVACRFAGEPWLPEFVRAVYDANFARDLEISEPGVVAECLARAGQAPEPLLAEAQAEPAKAALRAQGEEAARLGLFGAPSFVARGELFWGNDRLEAALAWQRRGEVRSSAPR